MSDAVIRLKIELQDTKPPIWRRIEVPSAISLKDLHSVIQAAMGWENVHLFRFEAGRERIDGPGLGGAGPYGQSSITAGRVRLDDLTARNIKRFTYLYDMGDNWEHELRIENVLPADAAVLYPRYIDGAGRCPPEDVGGIPGFYNLVEALGDPTHPDHEHLMEWHGGPFDQTAIATDEIRKRLTKIATRRLRKAAPSKRIN